MTRNQREAFQDLDDRAQQLLVTDRQLDADELPSVMQHLRDYPEVAKLMEQGGEVIAASQNLREAPETRALYSQKLVRPEQVADARFVSNLEYTLQSQAKKKRRHSTVPALQRQTREHRPKLKYYRGVTFAKK